MFKFKSMPRLTRNTVRMVWMAISRQWLGLLFVGIVFILTASSVELIIRSTVSIVFILQVPPLLAPFPI